MRRTEAMTVGALRDLLHDLPADMPVQLFNASYEWYGVEEIRTEALRVIDGKLVLNFLGTWEDSTMDGAVPCSSEEAAYRREERDRGR